MTQVTQLWNRLSGLQRMWLLAATVAVIGGLMQLNRWNQERDFKPLFTGLAPEDAGTITAKLRELGVDYRLGDNGSAILAPAEKVAEARLQLASAGLPKSGRIGFELFDKANFGASEFAEQVNYHRAIEGELERSVMSIREVEQARVHVTLAKDSLYTEQRQPAKASILIKLRSAGTLSAQHAAAICQLTASAVPGLSPDQVALVDTNGNLLNRPRAAWNDQDEAVEGALEYRKSIERDVQNKIGQTLAPMLGPEHFRAGVSAEVDLTSADQSEETYDPQKSVITNSQTTSDGPSLGTAAGVPGTASSLPNGAAKTSAGASAYARRSENVTYQTSRVVKHTKLPQGTVKRLSVSVLVDHSLRWEGAKRIVEAPAPEKLKVIRDLVAAVTGLNTDRGDQLVVEAFPFDATLTAEHETLSAPAAPAQPAAPSSPLQTLMAHKNFKWLAAIGGVAVVALIGGFAVMAMRRSKSKVSVQSTPAIEEAHPKEGGTTAQDIERQIQARMAEQASEKAKQEAEALMTLQLPAVATKKTDVLTKHIATEAKKDPTVMAQVVRSWLHGDNNPRR